MPSAKRRRVLWLLSLQQLVFAAGMCSPLLAEEPTTSAPASAPAADSADVRKLVANLRDPRWRVRELASAQLLNIGPAAYPLLREEFQRHTGYDLRRRIRNLVHDIYLSERLGSPRAFLGISHSRNIAKSTEDARVPPGSLALPISDTFADLPADRAGIRPGDLWVTLNGKPAAAEDNPRRFTDWIAAQRPGQSCTIGVIRGGEGFRLVTGATPGFKPQQFAQLKVRRIDAATDRRIPAGAAGLMVIEPTGLDPRLGLKAGDLIIGVDDKVLPADGAAERLHEWARSVARAPAEKPEAGTAPPAPAAASLQFLRGGQRLELHATLGRRPAYLKPLPEEVWNADAGSIEAAESGFTQWWDSEFDPGGSFAGEAAEDSLWQMDPGAARPRRPASPTS